MNLYNWLMANRTKEELAKELAAEAKKNAELENRVDELEHTVFWLQASEKDES